MKTKNIMSPKFELVKRYYDVGVLSISKVRNAVIHNWVTEEEFELITGEPLLKEIVGEPIFFFIVFVIQMLISVVNYVAAYACRKNKQRLSYIGNLYKYYYKTAGR